MGSILDFLFNKNKKTITKLDSNGNNGTTLTETIVCNSECGLVYNWTIEKTATPTELILFKGQSGGVDYNIKVYNDPITGEEKCIIYGRVCITNGGAKETLGLASTLELRYPPEKEIIYSLPLGIPTNTEIPAGETMCFDFSFSPPNFILGKSYKVTANTTILNHSGNIGVPTGPNESCSGNYPTEESLVYENINVKDSMFPLDPPKKFTAKEEGGYQEYSYTVIYDCDKKGSHENTATIVETGAASTATVNVICLDDTTTLSQKLSFEGEWCGEYEWDIKKEVSKEVLNLFKGDSESVDYIITVTNTSLIPCEEFLIKGEVCITNEGDTDTENLSCNLELRLEAGGAIIKTFPVDLSKCEVLTAKQSCCYEFEFKVKEIVEGGTYYLTSYVTINNYEGHYGSPYAIYTTEEWTLPVNPTPINEEVTVLDSYKNTEYKLKAVDDGGSQTIDYEVIYFCENEGINKNTAKIEGTNKESSTEVMVNCYCLEVSKTVFTSITKKYQWTIEKACIDPDTKEKLTTVNISALTYATLHYVVSVNPTVSESDFFVYGEIEIKNPNPDKDIMVKITDEIQVLDEKISAIVDKEEVLIEAGKNKTVKYSSNLDSSISGVNIATATYKSSTGLDVSCSSKAMEVDFEEAKVNEIDGCINVFDSYYGKLNDKPVCREYEEFYYTRVVGPYNFCCDCGKDVENIASYVGENTRGEVKNVVSICVV